MKAFIDFDGVLFDIEAAKKEYFQLFRRFDISADEAKRSYREMKDIIGKDEPSFHANLLRKKYPRLKTEKLLKAIWQFKMKSARFVHEEAREFLQELKRGGFELHLVTTGSREFQSMKIQSSGLKKLFAGIHILDTDYKGETILKLFGDSKRRAIFIDDKGYVVDEVKQCVPQVSVIQVSRKKDDVFSQRADYVARNLPQALRWIRKEIGLKIKD